MNSLPTDSELPPDVGEHRDWLLSLAPVPQTGLWVDLGCGSGDDLFAVAARHPQRELRLVGLDSSAKNVATATAARAHDSRVSFRQHHIGTELPFESAAIDVVHTHNLVECLGDRGAFVREVARVLKPGGRIVAGHFDWDSQVFDGSDKTLVRRLVHAYADWQQAWMDHADGWMGRRLWGTFNAPGLFDGAVRARVLTNTIFAAPWYGHARARDFGALVKRSLATDEDYDEFIKEQVNLSNQGRYFYSITGFAYVGERRAV